METSNVRISYVFPFLRLSIASYGKPGSYDDAMKLDVLSPREPWYAEGLKFTCTQCGNCCTGGPGYVWISPAEVDRLAEFLKITPRQVLKRYCRKVGGRWTLNERRTSEGLYDCVFLTDIDEPRATGTKELAAGQRVPLKRRGCKIYPVRPLQCRTWPFWHSNLQSKEMWEHAGKKCPGLDRGSRTFSRQQIESLRDAEDWPENPPGSQ